MKPLHISNSLLSVILLLTVLITAGNAQNIGVNNPSPDASALLDLTSTSKGLLIPRMTTAQRIAIGGPATGLLVFDNSLSTFYYYNGTIWTPLASGIITANNGLSISPANNVRLGGSNLIQNSDVGLNSYNMAWNGLGSMTIGTNIPTSNFLLTITPNTNTYRSGISMTLSGSSSTAYGMDITTVNNNVNGVRVTHSSPSISSSLYGIGSILSAANIVSGYLGYRTGSGNSYGVFGITGTNAAYAPGNVKTWAGFFEGRTVISAELAPTSVLGTDLEVRNTTTGVGNPATIGLRQSTSNTVYGSLMGRINFGDNYSASAPQAQILVIRGNTSSSAADVPTDMIFSTTGDGSGVMTERMRIRYDGNTGIGTAAPISRLHVLGSITMTDGNQAAGKVMVSDANGTGSWQMLTGSLTNAWSLTGNAGTVDGTNFIGTTDNVALNFRVNNQKAGRIDPIGTTLLGYHAGNLITTGVANTAMGHNALAVATTASNNTAFGSAALLLNTTGSGNTAVGSQALYSNLTGYSNTAVGVSAMYNNDSGNSNAALGHQALYQNTSGIANVALGNSSLLASTTGNLNTAVGYNASNSNWGGMYNTAVGAYALVSNTGGHSNVAVGVSALRAPGTAISNIVAVGDSSLLNNQGAGNTGIGSKALFTNTSGNNNTATGYHSLYSNTTGGWNTGNGEMTLNLNTIGSRNTAIGYAALLQNLSGERNTVVGVDAMYFNSSGSYNTVVGHRAGNGWVGTAITTGTYNTFIGYATNADNSNRTNTVLIGGNSNLFPAGDNRVRIGNASMGSIGGQVGWTTLSDERVKTDFSDDVPGLAFITQLRPVTYRYDVSASYKVQKIADTTDWKGKYDIEQMRFSGFRAQEVDKIAKEIGYAFSGVDKPQDEDGLWGLRYSEFVVPLVKAVQEQQQMIDDIRNSIRKLEEDNQKMKQRIDLLHKSTK